jgi:hypothetical protein
MSDGAVVFWMIVAAWGGVSWLYGRIRRTSVPAGQIRAASMDIGRDDGDCEDGDGGD